MEKKVFLSLEKIKLIIQEIPALRLNLIQIPVIAQIPVVAPILAPAAAQESVLVEIAKLINFNGK